MTLVPGQKVANRYAGFNRRMWAATIDSLIILFLFSPLIEMAQDALWGVQHGTIDIALLQQKLAEQTTASERLFVFFGMAEEAGLTRRFVVNSLAQIVLLMVLTGVCWKKWAATPGKILLRIHIVDARTGGPLCTRQIIVRLFGYLLSAPPLMLGFVWMSFNRRRQGWHDMLAGTVVVVKPTAAAVRLSTSQGPSAGA